MISRTLLTPILDDEHLTRRLDDAEARILVEWLVERAETAADGEVTENRKKAAVRKLYLRARAIGHFVALWCHEQSPSAALQFAATERFRWPLPTSPVDGCDLLTDILAWEDTPLDECDEEPRTK